MNRREYAFSFVRFQPFPAQLRHAKVFSEKSLCGACSETNEYSRLYEFDLGAQPRRARAHLRRLRLFVQPAFSPAGTRFPFEMLYDIGDVDAVAVDTSLRKGVVEKASCGPDERPALLVLFVARYFAYEHQLGIHGAFTKNGRPA